MYIKVAKLTDVHYPKQLYNNLRVALLRYDTGLTTNILIYKNFKVSNGSFFSND